MGRGTPHNEPRPGLETGPQAAISTEAVQAELEKILASSVFQTSARLRQFLRFTVNTVLGGSGERIKEYLVGVEVFGRDGSYDPRIDPVVRVEAGRLRAKLEEYYRTQGQGDPVLIDLPKGSYVPVFRTRQQTAPVNVSTDEPTPIAIGESVPERAQRPFWGLTPRSWAAVAGAFLLVLALGVWSRNAHPAPTSIAVLPFLNLSAAPENEYLSDGLSEELTTSLAELKGLRVVARTSPFEFRGKDEDVRKIGEQLNVGAVLEASVRREGDRLRVTAQLISTADGYHLWSGAYDGQGSDLFTIQENIVQETTRALRVPIPAEEERALAGRRTESGEAYDLYMQGRYFAGKRDVAAMQRSVQLFEGALQKDSGFALAYSGLADSYSLMAAHNQMAPEQAVPRATAAARRALELDPASAEAHTSLGLVKVLGWDWRGDEEELRRAVELNPNYALAHHGLATNYIARGRFQEADAELRKAQRLNPLSLLVRNSLAENFYYWRRWDDSAAQARYFINANPNSPRGYALLTNAYYRKGMYADALDQNQKALRLTNDPVERVLYQYQDAWISGNRAEALKSVAELVQLSERAHVPPYFIACLYATMGEKERALHWLEAAYERRDPDLGSMKVDPAMDPLHSDPRYTELLRKIGLAD